MTPHWTAVPNLIIDAMPQMGASVFKICVAVARKTNGYSDGNGGRKEWDTISLSQFQEMTGLSRQGVINAIEAASGKWLNRRQIGHRWEYQLVNSVDQTTPELVNSVDQPLVNSVDYLGSTSQLSRPELVNSVDTQKKERKTTTSSNGGAQLDPGFAEVCRTYENEIGLLTAMASDELQELLNTFTVDQITNAIRVAVRANVRRLTYVQGVLKRWQAEGFQSMQKTTQGEPTYKDILVPI